MSIDATSTETTAHIADSHDRIRVQGARESNLKNVNLEIAKRRLTVFTGVSGSGKSPLVFATIAAESQRLINETYSSFVQGFMPSLGRPDVDLLDGLTPAIIVGQERMGANIRSPLGTATDVNALLRILISRLGQLQIGSPNAFSFNVATISGKGAVTIEGSGGKTVERRSFSVNGGMCARCDGSGSVTDFDLSAMYDDSKSLNEGALTIRATAWRGGMAGSLTASISSMRTPRFGTSRPSSWMPCCVSQPRRSRSTASISPTWASSSRRCNMGLGDGGRHRRPL